MQDIKEALDKFLEYKGKEKNNVLLLKGGWGVGKTYFWDHYITPRVDNKNLNQIAYSYISLFGKTSLSDVRKSVFHSAQPTSSDTEIKEAFKIQFANSKRVLKLAPWVNWLTKITQHILAVGQFSNMISTVEYSLVNNYVICFDDLERKADTLTVKEIMGFIDELAIRKDCKVILLFNEKELHTEIDKKEFDLYREKIFDIELNYVPTYADNVSIAFHGYDAHFPTIIDVVKELDIKNIRILIKIRRTIDEFYVFFGKLDDSFIKELIKHITFLCWGYYTHNEEFLFDDIKTYFKPNMVYKSKMKADVVGKYERMERILSLKKPFYIRYIIHYLEQGFVEKEKILGELEEIVEGEIIRRAQDEELRDLMSEMERDD